MYHSYFGKQTIYYDTETIYFLWLTYSTKTFTTKQEYITVLVTALLLIKGNLNHHTKC